MAVISRRTLIVSAAASVAALGMGPSAKAILSAPEPTAPAISFEILREHEGGWEFGQITGAYAQGHIAPIDMARSIIKGMDGDDIAELLRPQDHPDLYDDDGIEIKDEEAAARLLSTGIRQAHATIRYGDGEDDSSWLFHTVSAEEEGAIPVTVLEWN